MLLILFFRRSVQPQHIEDGGFLDTDYLAVIFGEVLILQLLERLVNGVVLNEERHRLARLFVAVDGDHFHLRLVEVLGGVLEEEVEELPLAYLRCLALTKHKRLDLVNHLLLRSRTRCCFYQIRFLYFGGIILAGLPFVNDFHFKKIIIFRGFNN